MEKAGRPTIQIFPTHFVVQDPPGNYAHHRISQDRHENERKERFNNDEGYVPYSSIRMGVQDTTSYALRNEYLVLIDTIRRAQSGTWTQHHRKRMDLIQICGCSRLKPIRYSIQLKATTRLISPFWASKAV
ncbi:MAG: hypothetical protein QXP36_06620 [Conexivisphaerales archaeon]